MAFRVLNDELQEIAASEARRISQICELLLVEGVEAYKKPALTNSTQSRAQGRRYGLIGPIGSQGSSLDQTPRDLGYLEIENMGRVQAFVTRIDSILDVAPRRGLEQPVYCCRPIQNDHRASRSSRTRRAVLSNTEGGNFEIRFARLHD
jgi:hypothetical protein